MQLSIDRRESEDRDRTERFDAYLDQVFERLRDLRDRAEELKVKLEEEAARTTVRHAELMEAGEAYHRDLWLRLMEAMRARPQRPAEEDVAGAALSRPGSDGGGSLAVGQRTSAGDLASNWIRDLVGELRDRAEELKVKIDEEAGRAARRHEELTSADALRYESLHRYFSELMSPLQDWAGSSARSEIKRQTALIENVQHRQILSEETLAERERRSQSILSDTLLSVADLRDRLAALETAAEEYTTDSLRTVGTRTEPSRAQADPSAARRPVLVPTDGWAPDDSETIRTTLRLLRPYRAAGRDLVRLGRAYDGGYVLIDDFEHVSAALSLGINDDDSWDVDVVRRGVPVFQYDHTIATGPTALEGLTFYQQRISAVGGEGAVTLAKLIHERLAAGATTLVLKMDIESDEWRVIDRTETADLAHFSQIVCEFHNLERLGEAGFHDRARRCLAKLHEHFFVCHVHGNNCGPIVNVGNVPVPGTLEVTFANRARYHAEEAQTIYPTPLDMPNQEGRADIFLGTFRF